MGSMVSDTQMSSDTETKSQSDTTGSTEGKSHVDSLSKGNAVARGISQGFSDGIAIGLAPSASLGEANQWQFDPAILLTAILRKQQELLDVIAREGGFYTDVYALSSTERGKQALMALIPEAFHGVEDVVMGVQTRTLTSEEDRYIRKHAMAMVPSTREIRFPEAMTAYADSTLLTMLQASAYLSPGLFEEGTARSVQEKIPSFAFDPDLRAGIQIGLQHSTERGQLTDTMLRMTPQRHFHTALIGDTGSGKSVTAERLAYEFNSRMEIPHHRAGFRPGLAQGVELAGDGRACGHPPALPGCGAGLCAGTRCRSPNASTRYATAPCWWSCSQTPAGWGRDSWASCARRSQGSMPSMA